MYRFCLVILSIALLTTKLCANIDLVNAENNTLINTLNNYQTDIDLNAIGEREQILNIQTAMDRSFC